jgi:hypothetical protein
VWTSAWTWLRRLAAPPVFVVTFGPDGAATLARGTVPATFVSDCRTIAAEFAITAGAVEGVRTSHGVLLRFASEVPAASHQRFRNVFAACRPRGW